MWPIGYARSNVAVRLKYPNHSSNTDAHLAGDSLD
jgi:hypothetical protein